MSSRYFFVACQSDAEKKLEADLAIKLPELKKSFSKKGFLTLKAPDDFKYELFNRWAATQWYARCWGRCFGALDRTAHAALIRLSDATSHPIRKQWPASVTPWLVKLPLEVSLWHREEWLSDRAAPEKPLLSTEWLKAAGGELQTLKEPLIPGERLNLIGISPGVLWWGANAPEQQRIPFPGGLLGLDTPEEVPSRSWLKMEEMLLWSEAEIKKGDTIIELGCAPGGMSWNLLQRGARVCGVDSAEMDQRILDHPQFHWVRKSSFFLEPGDCPARAQWIVVDMNVDPGRSLVLLSRLLFSLEGGLKGLFFTLKINNDTIERNIGSFLKELRAMGFGKIRAAQLSSNRGEISVFATATKLS